MQRLKQGIAELKNQRVSTAKSEGGESVSPNTVGASFSSLFHNIRIRTSQNMSFFNISQGKTIFARQKECKIESSNEYNSIQNLSMSNLDKIEEIEIYT